MLKIVLFAGVYVCVGLGISFAQCVHNRLIFAFFTRSSHLSRLHFYRYSRSFVFEVFSFVAHFLLVSFIREFFVYPVVHL